MTSGSSTQGSVPASVPLISRSRGRSAVTFALPDAPGEVRARVETIARTLPQFTVTSVEPLESRLSRRPNLFTWGERIAIRWSPNGQGVDVSLAVDAKFPTAFGDYGQGRRDVEKLMQALGGSVT